MVCEFEVYCMAFQCPACQQESISYTQKFLLGKWATTHCAACGARLCAHPVVLAILYFLYIWDVMLFGYLGFVEYQLNHPTLSIIYAIALVLGWAFLEFLTAWVPMAKMKARPVTS